MRISDAPREILRAGEFGRVSQEPSNSPERELFFKESPLAVAQKFNGGILVSISKRRRIRIDEKEDPLSDSLG